MDAFSSVQYVELGNYCLVKVMLISCFEQIKYSSGIVRVRQIKHLIKDSVKCI